MMEISTGEEDTQDFFLRVLQHTMPLRKYTYNYNYPMLALHIQKKKRNRRIFIIACVLVGIILVLFSFLGSSFYSSFLPV